jgi:hypothetical protein
VLLPRSRKLNGAVERANRTHTEEFYQVTACSLEMDGAFHYESMQEPRTALRPRNPGDLADSGSQRLPENPGAVEPRRLEGRDEAGVPPV